MRPVRRSRGRATAAGIISGFSMISASTVHAATFAVDPLFSSLSVSGTAFDLPIQQQGPGSLTTTYQGPLLVQLSSSAINFPGGSTVAANNSGSWQPDVGGVAGSSPANYGGRVNLGIFGNAFAAVRNTVFDGTTTLPLAYDGSNAGAFSSALNFTAISGTIDYTSVLTGAGSSPVSGDSSSNASPSSATLNIAAGAPGTANATIFLPIQFTIVTDLQGLGQGVFNFLGSMTARATAIAGDANFDGRVNVNDFTILASNFGLTGRGWLSGDFNFDGTVNVNDFTMLASNFGVGASGTTPTPDDWDALASAVIPEPGAATLVTGVGASVAMWRRRRSRRGQPGVA